MTNPAPYVLIATIGMMPLFLLLLFTKTGDRWIRKTCGFLGHRWKPNIGICKRCGEIEDNQYE